MKIVINRCHGGFSVSKEVYKKLGLKSGYLSNVDFGIESNNYNAYRTHPKLIKTIEKIGIEKSNGEYAKLDIVEIPDGVDWTIEEYDGREWISEKHRTW